MTDEKVREEISNNDVDFIRIETEDLHGIPRSYIADVDYFLKSISDGIPHPISSNSLEANGSMVCGTGISDDIAYVNGTLYPDLHTFTVIPWKRQTASVYCDFKLEYGNPESASVDTSTRVLCKEQLKKLEELGYRFYSAFEYEFYVVDKSTKKPMHEDDNFAAACINERSVDFVYEIMTNMKKVGIKPEVFHSEMGPAQHEITQYPAFGISGPDHALRFKSITKEICLKHGYSALFLSKPFAEQAGSSGHFNHSLWSLEESTNLFHDVNQPHNLSSLAQNWLAGLQEHAKALMCLACPTYNCYERCKPNMFSPTNDAWGIGNRTVAFRVKNLSAKATYIENRIPGAAVNPYLITAGCIIAGIDGIKRNLKLKTPPYKGDLYKVDQLPVNINALPTSLSEALDFLKSDKLIVEGLGESFVNAFVAIKKQEIKSASKVLDYDLWSWYLKYYGEFI